MNRNIELIRYIKFEQLLLFELVNATVESEKEKSYTRKTKVATKGKGKYKTVAEIYVGCSDDLKNRFEEISQFILNLGEGIQFKKLRWYFAFKKIRTFSTFAFQPANDTIQMWVHADISKVKFEKGFTRDVSKIGHHGRGNLEVRIKNAEDVTKAKQYIINSYELS